LVSALGSRLIMVGPVGELESEDFLDALLVSSSNHRYSTLMYVRMYRISMLYSHF
jgi:hypothetical protein